MLNSKMLSSTFIAENNYNANEPKSDSFFYKAFRASEDIAQKALATPFIQGIKKGNLPPEQYGAYTVLDAYYCYQLVKIFDKSIEISHGTSCFSDNDLTKLIVEIRNCYQEYNSTLLNVWHIENANGISPTQNMQDYIRHDSNIADMGSVRTLIAILPCYYLWYWISDQILADDSYHAESNLYHNWVIESHVTRSAYTIGNFLETEDYFTLDEGLQIYRTSMEYELANFQDAYKLI